MERLYYYDDLEALLAGHIQAGNTGLSREGLPEELDSLFMSKLYRLLMKRLLHWKLTRLYSKHGNMAYVNSNTNFVSVKGDKL